MVCTPLCTHHSNPPCSLHSLNSVENNLKKISSSEKFAINLRVKESVGRKGIATPEGIKQDGFSRGVLVLLKFQVNSQKLGVQAPQNVEFE